MAIAVIGAVRGSPVRWDSRTGRVWVKGYALLGTSWTLLRRKAHTEGGALALAEDYFRR